MAGKDNPVADALSRATINLIVSTGFDYSAMSAAQQEDPDLASCRTTTSSLQLAQLPFGEDGLTLACDISTGTPRPIVPPSWRRRVFDVLHNLSHPGVRASRKLVSSKFVWYGMNKHISSATCARAFLFHWVSRFGLPSNISSDRGVQFTSQLSTALAELLGAKLHHTTAYHPQANGLVERFHRHLKEALRARLTDANWIDVLPWVLLGIRMAPKADFARLQQN